MMKEFWAFPNMWLEKHKGSKKSRRAAAGALAW
jgi:hypothetical protein